MEEKLTQLIIEQYIMERQKIFDEGWGDVAAQAVSGAAGAASRSMAAERTRKDIIKTQGKIKVVRAALSKCGDSKWCKVKKHAQLMALNNHLGELKRKRG